MTPYRFTEYFEAEVLRKMPYLRQSGVLRWFRIPNASSARNPIGIGSGLASPDSRAVTLEWSRLTTGRRFTTPSPIVGSRHEAELPS